MSLGNDHNVNLGLRIGMVECKDAVIFPDLSHLDLAGENILTVPVAICHLLSPCNGSRDRSVSFYCPAPSVSNNATAAMLIAIVVIQPNVLLMRPLTLLFMIVRLLPISMIIKSSGGATIPFNTAV